MAHTLHHYLPGEPAEIIFGTGTGAFGMVPRHAFTQELTGRIWQAHRVHPGVELHVCHVGMNTARLIVSAKSAAILAAWIGYLLGNTTLLSQRVLEHRDCLFTKGYQLSMILDEAALEQRVRAIFDSATSLDLVSKPAQWPGLHSVDRNCRGDSIRGYFADAEIRRDARRAGRPLAEVAPPITLTIEPLPHMRDWPAHRQQGWFAKIERDVIEATRARGQVGVPDAAALRSEDYARRGEAVSASAPACHGDEEKCADYAAGRALFVDAWYQRKARLIAGCALAACGFSAEGWVPLTYPKGASPEVPTSRLRC